MTELERLHERINKAELKLYDLQVKEQELLKKEAGKK